MSLRERHFRAYLSLRSREKHFSWGGSPRQCVCRARLAVRAPLEAAEAGDPRPWGTQQLSLRRRRGIRPASLPRERQDVSSVRPALSEHPLCAAQGPQPRSEVVSVLGDAGVQETVSPVGQDKSTAGPRWERERQVSAGAGTCVYGVCLF